MTKAKATPQKPGPKAPGHSVEEFRGLYDKSYIVPRKVRAALEKMGDSWLRELDFAKLAGVSANELAVHRDKFEGHIITLTGNHRGGRAWAGTRAYANKLRAMLA